MQISRLQRSYDARLRDRDDIATFSKKHNLPHSTKYHAITQPTEETRRDFAEAYAMEPLPPTDLPEHGTSAIIVFEHKRNKKHHGEMVTAAADKVANNLQPGIESIYIGAALNTAYREWQQPNIAQAVSALIANQGVPVMNTSIGWNDTTLSFSGDLDRQVEEMWKVTAFVVDSAGNEGTLDYGLKKAVPFQKHNAVSHAPPLVVHVGACSRGADGEWAVEGYSSANSPTFVAPVFPNRKAVWNDEVGPEPLIGTTLAAPYASGTLSALNYRYGRYLTREQILYAVLATCEKVNKVNAFIPKTTEAKTLDYVTNAAGLTYNPEYAGFGRIQPHAANRLLSQMVALTQANPDSISVPVEERVKVEIPSLLPPEQDENGHYIYTIRMPAGVAMKTTLNAEFKDAHGTIHVTSPSGTRLPLVMSRLPNNDPDPNAPTDSPIKFGISTSHGWAGESLEGEWRIESTEPICQLQMNQHHFMAHDIVKSLDVPALMKLPTPVLADARPLTEIAHDRITWRTHRDVKFSGMAVGGEPPQFENYETIVAQLKQLPSAFTKRNRIYSTFTHEGPGTEAGNEEEKHAAETTDIDRRIEHYLRAAALYERDQQPGHQAAALASAGRYYLYYRPSYTEQDYERAQHAVALFEQSISIHKEAGYTDHAYLDTCQNYRAHSRILGYAQAVVNTELEQQELAALKIIRHEAKALWELYSGGGDPSAHRVEEGEMGFSDHERIGTDNVGPCLTIIARDPVTLKTGLVHLDNEADVNSLDTFFEHFSHNRLEVRLVGALSVSNGHSQKNVENVVRYLADKNIDIISADILNGGDGISAMVVDPHTFALSERVPTKATINAAIGNAALLFTRPGKPLVKQFDFTESKNRSPIFLSRNSLQKLRSTFIGKDEGQLEHYFNTANYTNRPIVIDNLLKLIQAYQTEWSALEATLDETLLAQGANEATARKAHDIVLNQRFFVGENAHAANQPVHDWIRNDLIVHGKLQHAATLGVRLDDKPHRLSFELRQQEQRSHRTYGMDGPG